MWTNLIIQRCYPYSCIHHQRYNCLHVDLGFLLKALFGKILPRSFGINMTTYCGMYQFSTYTRSKYHFDYQYLKRNIYVWDLAIEVQLSLLGLHESLCKPPPSIKVKIHLVHWMETSFNITYYKEEVKIWLYATMMINNTLHIFNLSHLHEPKFYFISLMYMYWSNWKNMINKSIKDEVDSWHYWLKILVTLHTSM